MKYKYQLHTHTSPTGKCARTLLCELAKALCDRGGYTDCVITNHFLHGNIGTSRDMSFWDFIGCYERDLQYLELLKNKKCASTLESAL